MNNRSIALTFNDQKQHIRQIKIDISQKLSISSILFFIYIRFLFSKIWIKIQISFFNFIDDIQINVSSKNIENNCKTLIEIIKIAFSWIDANAIQFDDSKFKLIHFESKKIMLNNSIILSNERILKFQNMIKWLNVWIDQKLTFKTHVEKRLIFAIKIFYSISQLQNFEWNLVFMITRQLYQTCITAISDYDFEIWWNDQKSYAEKFQKLQNLKLQKILKIFKTSSISIMKIEINIQWIKIQLNQKNKKLILQIIKLNQRYLIQLKILWKYFSEQIHELIEIIEIEFESEFMKFIIEKNQFLNWNQFEKSLI